MYKQRVSTSESPRVEVTACQGDLTVTTWDKAEVLIEVDSEQVLTVEERDDTVALAANSDCRLTVPPRASLVAVQVQGDLSVRGVGGTVEVVTAQGDAQFKDGAGSVSSSTVQGDLTVKDWAGDVNGGAVQGDAEVRRVAGTVSLTTVGGDLTAEDIGGALAAGSVRGDAYLRGLSDTLSLGSIGADLIARDLSAGADVAQAGGDVSLKSVFAGPHTFRIQARGNVAVKALPGSDATFTLQAGSGRVRVKGLTGETTEEGRWQGVIGDGKAQVTLTCTHGNVTLKALAEGEEVKEYAAFVHTAPPPPPPPIPAEEVAWRIQQRVAEKLSKIDFEAIARREAESARRHAEREAARAQRAAEKVRRRAERAQRKAQKKKMQWHVEWDTGRGARRTSRHGQGASEEERVAILRMLAEGKISAQEAEILLQALEG